MRQLTTIPEGVAPAGPAMDVSGVRVPPSTVKPVTAFRA